MRRSATARVSASSPPSVGSGCCTLIAGSARGLPTTVGAGDLGEAGRRQVSRASAAEASVRQLDAHLALGDAAAHAVAEAHRAGLGVELEGRRLARDHRIGRDRGEVLDPRPWPIALAGRLDPQHQARCIDRAGR